VDGADTAFTEKTPRTASLSATGHTAIVAAMVSRKATTTKAISFSSNTGTKNTVNYTFTFVATAT
jgi:hypothetical protein